MADGVTIEPIDYPSDGRGWVLEPIGPGDLPEQRNVHLTLTRPGAIRGNHYHRRGREISVVVGPALLRYRLDGRTHDVEFGDGQAARVTIEPGVPHAFKNTGDRPLVLIGFNTEVHDPANPDVVREVLL